jgi:dolichyl-phosphate beta-glucosyltransferase
VGEPVVVSFLRRRWPDVAVLALFLLLALWITGGMLRRPGHTLVTNDSDVALLSWFLQHDAHALAHGGRGLLFTDDLNAPAGVNLMWNTALLLPGILLAPLTWLTSGRTSFAVLLWLAPALSAFACYVVLGVQVAGRVLVTTRAARVAAALLFGFSPALIAQSLGHLQMILLPLVPVILLLVLEAALGERRAVIVGVTAGLVAAAQLLTGEEVLFLTSFVAVLVLIALIASRPRQVTRERVARFATITGIALGVFLCITAVPLWVQLFGAQHVHGTPFTRDYFKLDVSAFTTSTKAMLLGSRADEVLSDAYRGGPEEHTGYLGYPLLILAGLMLVLRWRDLRVRIPVLVSVVLSVLALGLHPIVSGVAHDDVTLPWALLIDKPLFESVIVSRLPLMSALLLGLALAVSLEWMADVSKALGVVVGFFALLPLVPVPLDTSRRGPVPEFFASGAKEVPAGAAVVVAPPAGYDDMDAMRWQTASGFRFRLTGGYFIGPSYDGHAVIGPLPRTLLVLLDQVRQNGRTEPPSAQERAAVAIDLEYFDARAVVVGPMPHRADAIALVTALLGTPPEEVGGVSLWRL